MAWRPKTWIAVVLAILFQPLAMLYLMRAGWALVYFLAITVMTVAELYLLETAGFTWLRYFSFTYLIIIICIIHAYRLSKHFVPTPTRPWYSRWYGLTGIVLLFYAGTLTARIFLFQAYIVPSGSMLPNFPIGSELVVVKWGYGNYRLFDLSILKTELHRQIRRGDVVVFDYPENPSIQYVKRVVGLPGDRLEYRNNKLIINGIAAKYTLVKQHQNVKIYRESLGKTAYLIQLNGYNRMANEQYTVPKHAYFVLGDNRDNSRDSRYWGFVPADHIIGKVIYTLE